MLKKSDASPTTSLSVTWTIPGDNDNNVKYKVRLDRVSSISISGTDMEATSPYTFTSLVPGAGYKVFVWAEAGDLTTNGQKSITADSGIQIVYTGKVLTVLLLLLLKQQYSGYLEYRMFIIRIYLLVHSIE